MQEPEQKGSAPRDGSRPARILLVDDDRLILATLGSGLRLAGYEVLEASSGEEALRLCQATPPDLAILDMRMPGMSGVEVAGKIRAGSVPFLFLSAYSDTDLVRLAVQEGALGYLVKPLDLTQIVPAVEAALARAAELRQLRVQEERLTRALGTSRTTATAVGVVMERHRLNRAKAFELLRYQARSQRRKLEEVASEVLGATESLNFPPQALVPGEKS